MKLANLGIDYIEKNEDLGVEHPEIRKDNERMLLERVDEIERSENIFQAAHTFVDLDDDSKFHFGPPLHGN